MGTMFLGPDDTVATSQLADRAAVIDAVYRFGAGQDYATREVYESAFTEDATLDFEQPAERFGASAPTMRGRDVIMEIAYPSTQDLVTTHTVTNPRVRIDGDQAEMWCLVEAQHVLPAEPSRHLLLKNIYELALRREAPGWRISAMRIENLWSDGDPSVLFGER